MSPSPIALDSEERIAVSSFPSSHDRTLSSLQCNFKHLHLYGTANNVTRQYPENDMLLLLLQLPSPHALQHKTSATQHSCNSAQCAKLRQEDPEICRPGVAFGACCRAQLAGPRFYRRHCKASSEFLQAKKTELKGTRINGVMQAAMT